TPPPRFARPPQGGDTSGPAKPVPRYLWTETLRAGKTDAPSPRGSFRNLSLNMPAYTFEALDAKGATQKGLIDADTARSARGMLRARSLVPILVEPTMGASGTGESSSGLNVTLWAGRIFNATALAVWTRQLAGLVAAGLPLERALAALTEEAEVSR